MNKKNKQILGKISLSNSFWRYLAVAALVISLAVSLTLTVQSYNIPVKTKGDYIISRISQKGVYHYIAEASPSLIYNNESEIGEGRPLYLKLVKGLNIGFTYTLASPQGIRQVNGTIETSIVISSYTWRKTYLVYPPTHFNTSKTSRSYSLNLSDILSEAGIIEKEIGSRSGDYNITLTNIIHVSAILDNGRKYIQTFTPALNLEIKSSNPLLYVDGLRHSDNYVDKKAWSATNNLSIMGAQYPVSSVRKASLLTSSIISPLLAFAIIKGRGKEGHKDEIRELLEKYDDIIVKGRVSTNKALTTIELDNFKEMAQISDRTLKPVLNDGSDFYLVDGGILYHYRASSQQVKQ